MNLQPNGNMEYIFLQIGAFIGSVLVVGFVSLIIFFLNNFFRKKEVRNFYVVSLSVLLVIVVDIFIW